MQSLATPSPVASHISAVERQAPASSSALNKTSGLTAGLLNLANENKTAISFVLGIAISALPAPVLCLPAIIGGVIGLDLTVFGKVPRLLIDSTCSPAADQRAVARSYLGNVTFDQTHDALDFRTMYENLIGLARQAQIGRLAHLIHENKLKFSMIENIQNKLPSICDVIMGLNAGLAAAVITSTTTWYGYPLGVVIASVVSAIMALRNKSVFTEHLSKQLKDTGESVRKEAEKVISSDRFFKREPANSDDARVHATNIYNGLYKQCHREAHGTEIAPRIQPEPSSEQQQRIQPALSEIHTQIRKDDDALALVKEARDAMKASKQEGDSIVTTINKMRTAISAFLTTELAR